MLKPTLLFALVLTAIFALPSPALAGGGKKGKKGNAATGRILSRFDRNHDGSLDSQEAERLKTAYSALAALDTDHDGKLSDTEVAAAKVPAAGAKKGAKKKAK